MLRVARRASPRMTVTAAVGPTPVYERQGMTMARSRMVPPVMGMDMGKLKQKSPEKEVSERIETNLLVVTQCLGNPLS